MYSILLVLHSFLRWFVLLSLMYAIYRAYQGYQSQKPFTKWDNFIRHSTATIAHLQLLLGLSLYHLSPVVHLFWTNKSQGIRQPDLAFFAGVHGLLMLLAIIILTIGSALAKRQSNDRARFRTMLIWFSLCLMLILLAIPWPFSPIAARPYIRLF